MRTSFRVCFYCILPLLLLSSGAGAKDDRPFREGEAQQLFSEKQQREHLYRVKINDELTRVDVEICFRGKVPEYLVVDSHSALDKLIEFPKTAQGFIEFQGRYWKTEKLPSNACIEYASDISEHLIERVDGEKMEKVNYQAENGWLWLPESLAKDEVIRVEFDLKPRFFISVPWQADAQSNRKFKLFRAPHHWGSTMVFGDIGAEQISLGDERKVNLALLGNFKDRFAIRQWIVDSAKTLTDYLGYFPEKQLQVIVISSDKYSGSPVPWGEVNRGGGNAIKLVISPEYSISAYYQDWTVFHEFSHLLLPKIEYKSSWLAEGLASYLQYLLMSKAGVLTKEVAWQKLYQGLKRGENGTSKLRREKLTETLQRKRERGKQRDRTMRIYWTGAAYFLSIDRELYKASGGKSGLREVLAEFNRCCTDSGKLWTGRELVSQLDRLSSSNLFSSRFEAFSRSESFPDYESVFESLGVKIDTQHSEPSVQLVESVEVDIRNLIN
ncbi:hypothetical protein [Aliikangiella sp. G2MR2-5]|uniref:M61 family metallopeptidase n=1 Tax=Aliikangiella sp. G2MR2-5 TaxID=2788943 RepID=UPI0018A89F8E|nr:hypothetical protein [Aliikangiella sp. G2MR2-5]